MTDEVDSFGIVLPVDWMQVPLESAEFEQFVRGQRRRLAADGELSATASRQFELLMRQMRNDALREKVTLAATMIVVLADSVDDAGEPVESGLLTAVCTISTIDRHDLGSELPLTVNTIAAAMGRTPPVGDDGVEISNLEPPEIIELTEGRAVKLVRLHRYPTATIGETLPVFAQHVLVPFDDGQRAAVVTFSSVTPRYAKPLSRLFDRMTETFRMFGGDMPTDPLAPPAARADDVSAAARSDDRTTGT